jgi:hypothetical protein
MTEDWSDEIESDSLREAELMQVREILKRLIGRTITDVRFEETRIALETDDGAIRYFYGYMGEDVPEESPAE